MSEKKSPTECTPGSRCCQLPLESQTHTEASRALMYKKRHSKLQFTEQPFPSPLSLVLSRPLQTPSSPPLFHPQGGYHEARNKARNEQARQVFLLCLCQIQGKKLIPIPKWIYETFWKNETNLFTNDGNVFSTTWRYWSRHKGGTGFIY